MARKLWARREFRLFYFLTGQSKLGPGEKKQETGFIEDVKNGIYRRYRHQPQIAVTT
jgi:hypothetical protein